MTLAGLNQAFGDDSRDCVQTCKQRIATAIRTKADVLDLEDLGLFELPEEISQAKCIRRLLLGRNSLTDLPRSISTLNLSQIDLSANSLTIFPTALLEMRSLTKLDLSFNSIQKLPLGIANLAELKVLKLCHNPMREIPSDLDKLIQLEELWIRSTRIQQLPQSLHSLKSLREIQHAGSELVIPPLNIVGNMHISRIKAYLRNLGEHMELSLTSKVHIVGNPESGKSTLLDRIMKDSFTPLRRGTHGMEVHSWSVSHPNSQDEMTVSFWDFGGQEIYHATHQFFLTDNSLFIVCWNARLGHERGEVSEWLDQLKARVPNSPIIIVATHVGDFPAHLPIHTIRNVYGEIQAFDVESETGEGIPAVRDAITRYIADLRYMRLRVPSSWSAMRREIFQLKNAGHLYIDISRYFALATSLNIDHETAANALRWITVTDSVLHYDLPVLRQFVFLDPARVNELICRLVESPELAKQCGVLAPALLDSVDGWQELDSEARSILLTLMSHFDLSFEAVGDKHGMHLVVQQLPTEPKTVDGNPFYHREWENLVKQPNVTAIEATFSTNVGKGVRSRHPMTRLPAGVPAWFIARSRAYSSTVDNHWRDGVYLSTTKHDISHFALLAKSANGRDLNLAVRGPYPKNFFSKLRDILHFTVQRYEGLDVSLNLSCPNSLRGGCQYTFDLFSILAHAMQQGVELTCLHESLAFPTERLVLSLEAPDRFYLDVGRSQRVANNQLLTRRLEMIDLLVKDFHENYRDDCIHEFRELVQREYCAMFARLQAGSPRTSCPFVFALRPRSKASLLQNPRFGLRLYCQSPGNWHCAPNGSDFELESRMSGGRISDLVSQLQRVGPLIRGFVEVLKAGRLGKQVSSDSEVESDFEFMHSCLDEFPRHAVTRDLRNLDDAVYCLQNNILDRLEDSSLLQGLERVVAADGNILWLCSKCISELGE